jgi:hypothetical protein
MSVRDLSVDVRGPLTNPTWSERLAADQASLSRRLPSELRPLHDTVVARAQEARVRGLILTGSTARARRTEISDLDYHVIGTPIPASDLSRELDLHVLSDTELEAAILSGDDFVQWSLRLGLIVLDDGVLRHAARLVAEHRPWPDVARKARHAARSVELARRFVATGDEDGALEQVRTALSLAARSRLLSSDVFPLSRAELPEQLASLGFKDAAEALRATIDGPVSLDRLARAVQVSEELLPVSPAAH